MALPSESSNIVSRAQATQSEARTQRDLRLMLADLSTKKQVVRAAQKVCINQNHLGLKQLGINDVAAAYIGNQRLQACSVVHVAHRRNPFPATIIPGPAPL